MPEPGPLLRRLTAHLPALVGVVLFAAAAWVLHRELRNVHVRDVAAALSALPATVVLAALALTAANYAVLTGYDQLAFSYIGKRVARWRISAASFVGFAISLNVGFSLLSGTSARYRFYSRWGLTPADLSRVVVFYSGTIWLGLFTVGGAALAFAPPQMAGAVSAEWLRAVGIALLGVAAAYAVLPFIRRAPLRFGGFELPVPSPRMVPLQFAVGCSDWLLSSAVLYTLLPADSVSFPRVVGVFIAAQVVGVVSHVPGGLGVFESMVLLQLDGVVPADALLGSLVLFRLVFFLVPLAVALLLLVADEVRQRRTLVREWSGAFGSLSVEVAPKVISIFVFAAGAVLLFSGAVPPSAQRMAALAGVFPWTLIEGAHFLGSVVGVLLLVAAYGVSRRLVGAYYGTLGLLVAGIVTALLRGGDWVEALLLAALALVLVPAWREFDRRAGFWDTRFPRVWIIGVLAVVAGSVALGQLAFGRVELTEELWLEFGLRHEAPRFLRASVGAALTIVGFAALRLLRRGAPEAAAPGVEALARAEGVVGRQARLLPHLALLGDKALLWNARGDGFVAYASHRRTWIALGDPVAPDWRTGAALVRTFVERADDYQAVPVVFGATGELVNEYADFGLLRGVMGEQAFVPLDRPLADPDGSLARALARAAEAGMRFRVLTREEVAGRIESLRQVAEGIRQRKRPAGRGFAVPRFHAGWVRRYPAAVLERNGRVEAFATLLASADASTVGTELVRTRGGGAEVLDALYLYVAEWAREAGYARLDLGMAPPADLGPGALAKLWWRLGRASAFRDVALHDLQAMRRFRERFRPVWEPRYLVYPGGLPLRRVVAELTGVLSGAGRPRVDG